MEKEQTGTSVNQIKAEKPKAPKCETVLVGHTGGSFNAGHYSPIHMEYVMAGTKIENKTWSSKLKLLTPKSPSYQPLYLQQRTFFVPFSRIWRNYNKFMAQKGGSEITKIQEIPNLGGKTISDIEQEDTDFTPLFNSMIWRDSITSRFIPRLWGFFNDGSGNSDNAGSFSATLPKMSVLPLRAITAIWNDFLRNKEYEEEREEFFNDDTVSAKEWAYYLPTTNINFKWLKMRANLPNSYFTNYRTELQGENTDIMASLENFDPDQALLYWTNVENATDYIRNQAVSAMKNDWDIVAELRNSRPALEQQVRLISKTNVPLNYSAVTQNTYNNNEEVDEQYRALGQQGAYSYTDLNLKLVEYFEPIEDGIIMTICNVWAETVYSTSIHRTDLNVNHKDIYRPDLAAQKVDVLYDIESGTNFFSTAQESSRYQTYTGFKRKFSELFTGRNMIYGDMTPNSYFKYSKNNGEELTVQQISNSKMSSNNTFTFYENSRYTYFEEDTGFEFVKAIWKDYSDLMLDKNQAVREEKIVLNDGTTKTDFVINGHNQIYFVGKTFTKCQIPVEESIRNDYTTWGEH